MKYTRVRRAVSAVVIDSWDKDRNPEHIKVNGNVTFTPLLKDGDVVQWAGPNGPESLVLAPIQCRISDGIIMHRGGEGVYLAAGGKGCEPDLIQWKAEFSSMQAGGWAFKLKPVMFDAVPDGEVDLTMVAPVAGASEPIVRGPAGTGIDKIRVEKGELVITARSEAGVFEMARIPLEDVVKAEAATAAKSAADNVRTEFTTAASNAAASAKSATTSAQTATTKAGEATTQATNAKASAAAAKTSETNAATSASAAATSATKAGTSATNAKNDADRAANIANSTSWNGDKLTVNGKTSPSLTGPRGQQGEQGPPGTVEAADAPPVKKNLLPNLRREASADEMTLTVIGTTAMLTFTNLKSPASWTYLLSSSFPAQYAPAMEIRGAVISHGSDDPAGIIISADGGVSCYSFKTELAYTGLVTWPVPGPGGPVGPPGEVTKAQLDTAFASEKARTVGVTWTVPRESDVAAKTSAAQTGDYIQVAQTRTIYRVTSSGVTVEKYGTRTLQAATDPSSNRNPNQWLESGDPWAGVNWSRVSPPAGKWLIEIINPHNFPADLYVEGSKVTTVTSGTAAYTTEFSTAAKSDVYVQIPGDNHYKPITLRFTPIN